MLLEPIEEIADSASLLTKESRRADVRRQLACRERFQAGISQQSRAAQFAQGQRGIPPGSVLRQDGAQNDFQPSFRRPPVLRTEACVKGMEVSPQFAALFRFPPTTLGWPHSARHYTWNMAPSSAGQAEWRCPAWPWLSTNAKSLDFIGGKL